MNYLTMCRPTTSQTASNNVTPSLDISRIENNIYSIPLFHNEFYENVQTAIRTSCDITQACRHHICNETLGANEPHPCGSVRYTPETWRRNMRDTVQSINCRESGTESLNINCDTFYQPQSEVGEIHQDTTDNMIEENKAYKQDKCRINKTFIAIFIGIIVGICMSSIAWLTVENFKHAKFNCIVQSSLTLEKNLNSSAELNDLETNEITNLSEKVSTLPPNISKTQIQQESFSSNSTIAESSSHSPVGIDTTINPLSTETNPISLSMPDSDFVTTLTSSLQSTDATTESMLATSRVDTIAQSKTISSEITSTTDSERTSLSSLQYISSTSSLTSVFTQEPQTSSFVSTDKGEHSPHAEGLSQTTVESTITSGGHVYYRWGRKSCPVYSELIYAGFVAGGHYIHSGGAANNLCLPSNPTWGNYNDAIEPDRNLIHVTEYESSDAAFNTIMGKSLHDQNVPCAVCQATGRNSFLMIPGRTECSHGWYQEYTGYVMGGSFEHPHGKSVICVDGDPQVIPGRGANENGNLLYFVEFRGTNTEHYVNGRELSCVVCTR